MLNHIVLVGRLAEDPKIEENINICKITLIVPRPYKNIEGEYDNDYIDCILMNGVAQNTTEYCHKGDLIGIKGRIQTTIINDKKITDIIADRVTILKNERESENNE